jgi:hypothetical protein
MRDRVMLVCEKNFYNELEQLNKDETVNDFIKNVFEIYHNYMTSLDMYVENNLISHFYDKKYEVAKNYVTTIIYDKVIDDIYNNMIKKLKEEIEKEYNLCFLKNQVSERYIFLKKLLFELPIIIKNEG